MRDLVPDAVLEEELEEKGFWEDTPNNLVKGFYKEE